jgi:hypothetical protein
MCCLTTGPKATRLARVQFYCVFIGYIKVKCITTLAQQLGWCYRKYTVIKFLHYTLSGTVYQSRLQGIRDIY